MNNPPLKVSIVTACLNQAKYLETAILSVLDQKYPNLEYIIVDGGSTDGSIEIIKKYQKELTFWCSEKDQGQYDAINKGFAKSTGDILAFLNADDLYLPWTLHTVASIFSSTSKIQWLTSLVPLQKNSDNILFASGIINPISRNAFLDGLYVPGMKESLGVIVQEGTFWTRSLWEKIGAKIDVNVSLAGDFDLWCKFYRYAEPIGYGYPLAAMTRHKDQRSNMHSLYIEQSKSSLNVLRKCSNYKISWLKFRYLILKLSRLNRSAWALGRRLVNYYGRVVDPISDASHKVTWRIKKVVLYIK